MYSPTAMPMMPFRRLFLAALLCGAPVAAPASATALCPPEPSPQEPASTRVSALCDTARAREATGSLDAARSLYEQALRLDGESLPALTGLGRVLTSIPGQWEEALRMLQRAVRLHPDSDVAHYELGRAYRKLALGSRGGSFDRLTRTEFETAIALNPSHGDAYYQLGLLLRDSYEDFDTAEQMFRSQADVAPDHAAAAVEMLHLRMDRGEWAEAIETGERLLRAHPENAGIHPFLAAAYWKAGRLDEALDTFDRFFSVADEKERNLYLDLSLVLTTEEQQVFDSLDEQGRRVYWGRYWRERDPDPTTPVNERLLEHYIRVAWARVEFGQQVWPWDYRGQMYVRYGEPDVRAGRGRPVAWEELVATEWDYVQKRQQFELSMGLPYDYVYRNSTLGISGDEDTAAGGMGSFDSPEAMMAALKADLFASGIEQWAYLDRGIQLTFEDPTLGGRYLLAGDMDQLLADQMEEKYPIASDEEDKIDYLNPLEAVFTFKGDGGRTEIGYTFALLPEDFGGFRSATGRYAQLDVEVQAFTPEWHPATEAMAATRRLSTVPQLTIRGTDLFMDSSWFELEPGAYILTALLVDPVSGRRATVEERVDVPRYGTDELQVSDILPAADVDPSGARQSGYIARGNFGILPLPGRSIEADRSLYVYYEVYNLTRDPYGATDYEITYSVAEAPEESRGLASRLYQGLRSLVGRGRRQAILSTRVEGTGILRDTPQSVELELGSVEPGVYEISVQVLDRISGRTAGNSVLVRTLPAGEGAGR